MKKEKDEPGFQGDEKPPIFKTWRSWYLLVIFNLLFLILLFYAFTLAYK